MYYPFVTEYWGHSRDRVTVRNEKQVWGLRCGEKQYGIENVGMDEVSLGLFYVTGQSRQPFFI